MIELKQNKKTGLVEAWKDGRKIGVVNTMGNEIIGNAASSLKTDKQNNKKKRGST